MKLDQFVTEFLDIATSIENSDKKHLSQSFDNSNLRASKDTIKQDSLQEPKNDLILTVTDHTGEDLSV